MLVINIDNKDYNNMSKKSISFIFPGQGSQNINMGKFLYENYNEVKSLFNKVSDILKFDIRDILFSDINDDNLHKKSELLMNSIYTQIGIVLVSISTLYVIELLTETKCENFVNIVAGHSLGEYSALYANSCFSFNDIIEIVKKRGEIMSSFFQKQNTKYRMLALLDVSAPIKKQSNNSKFQNRRSKLFEYIQNKKKYNFCAKVKNASNSQDDYIEKEYIDDILDYIMYEGLTLSNCKYKICELALKNSPYQFVLGGDVETIRNVARLAYELGIRSLYLPIDGAFHLSILKNDAELFGNFLSKFNLSDFKIPIISNYTTNFIQKDELKDVLVKQIYNKVIWEDSMNLILKKSDIIIEIGPRKVLNNISTKYNMNSKLILSTDSFENIVNAVKIIRDQL